MNNKAKIKNHEKVKAQYEKWIKDADDALEDSICHGDDMAADLLLESIEMFIDQIERLEWEIEKLTEIIEAKEDEEKEE